MGSLAAPGVDAALVHQAHRLAHDRLWRLTGREIVDVAAIGNASGVYEWQPCALIDLDFCVFVRAMDEAAGRELLAAREHLAGALADLDIDFELRIIRGPYKPAAPTLARPYLLAHLAVFSEQTYGVEPVFLRWGWRKYRCRQEADRLLRLAPPQPGLTELLHADAGVLARLAMVRSGRVSMREWHLPGLDTGDLLFAADHPVFAEYCLSSCATIARNHARALGRSEADQLPNDVFASWYMKEVLANPAYAAAMKLKAQARRIGYGGTLPRARVLATTYLGSLADHLRGAAS